MTVHRVIAHIRQPSGTDSLGQITEGFYTVKDNVLTMTNPQGEPVDAEMYCHTLRDGENPEPIAKVLTKKIRRHKLGLTEDNEDFGRRLDYGTHGIA